MKNVRYGRVLAVLLALALVLCLAGCQKQTTTGGEAAPVSETTTKAPDVTVTKKGTTKVLKHITVKNGNYEYTYDYDYDFDTKTVDIVAKGVPAGDRVENDAYTWYMTRDILNGSKLEALPDSSGANEELTLWAQPLLYSGDILRYRTTVYEEDSTKPASVLTYEFAKDSRGRVSDAQVKYDFEGDDYDYDALVKYRYDEAGNLRRVTESSETRDLIWEFTRDESGRLTNESFETITKENDAIDHWLSLTEYVYDSDGVLIATKTKADGSQLGEWATRYLFSETTGTLSMVTDEFTRTSFGYDEDLKELVLVKSSDIDSGETYWRMEFSYTDVELP